MNAEDTAILFKVSDQITDLSNSTGYKQIVPDVYAAYTGIGGLGEMAKATLAHLLFYFLLKTKYYGLNANNNKRVIDEHRRIYTDIPITMDSILRDHDNKKYSIKQEAAKASSNMLKRIQSLDKDNIYHYWRYGRFFMFVMERDYVVWAPYNPKSMLPPKMLKKIIGVSSDMIYCMREFITKSGAELDISDIDASFGSFINRLIDKMNPLVAAELPRYPFKTNLDKYLEELSVPLSHMDNYAGCEIDDAVYNNLPASIAEKTQKKVNEEKEMNEKKIKSEVRTPLEKDIIPKNPNIARARRTKSVDAESAPVAPPSIKAQAYSYSEDIDPLNDARHFVTYYRAFLQMRNKDIRFDDFASDARYACEVMDLMKANHYAADKAFLIAWLNYFWTHRLKGGKALKSKYTSVQAFRDTFKEFEPRYVDIAS